MRQPRLPLLRSVFVRGVCAALPLALPLTLWAAPNAAEPTPSPTPPATMTNSAGQRVEHIHHEDDSVAIDEVRVGGQTQSIEVKPSNEKLRPYQVQPDKGGSAGIASPDNAGKGLTTNRSWKLFNF